MFGIGWKEALILALPLLVYGGFWFRRRFQQGPEEEDEGGEFSVNSVENFHNLEEELNKFDLKHAPFSTGLFPSDLHLLFLHGYEPIQIVTGNVTYSLGIRGVTSSVMRAFRQGEMKAITRMLNDARLIARNRMVEQARQLNADGIIGVTYVDNDVLDFTEVTAMGTAIKRVGPGLPKEDHPALDVAVQ